jgi:hypothetical protein
MVIMELSPHSILLSRPTEAGAEVAAPSMVTVMQQVEQAWLLRDPE